MVLMIRLLDLADYDAFRALRASSLEAHPESYSTDAQDWRQAPREKVDAMLSAGGPTGDLPIFGAFRPDLIGMVGLRREQRPVLRHKASLWGLYVDPNHRRATVATQLMTAAIDHASSQSELELVRLVVDADNTAAIAVFERSGFERYGLEPRARLVDGAYHDQVYMCRFVRRERSGDQRTV